MKNVYSTKIDMTIDWKKCCLGEITFSDFAGVIATKLENLQLHDDKFRKIVRDDFKLMRSSLVDQFNDLSNQKSNLKEFSQVMEKFHAWGECVYTVSPQHGYLRNCEITM